MPHVIHYQNRNNHWFATAFRNLWGFFFLIQSTLSVSSFRSKCDDSIYVHGLLGSHFGIPCRSATYDYVVVGAGTAGLTVAGRIAAKNQASVAVIEAGDFYEFSNGNFSQVPAYASYFTGNDPEQKNPHLDWYQYTEPQLV